MDGIALLLLGVVYLVPASAAYPKCLFCVPQSRILAPGFGIDITTSYATSSVRYHNCSRAQLSRVDSAGFAEILGQYSADPSLLKPHSNHQSLSKASLEDVVDSAEVLLSSLIRQTSRDHRLQIDTALVSVFSIEKTYMMYDVMHKAAEAAGLKLLLDGPTDMRPAPVGAAAAANGIALCEDYRRPDLCAAEEAKMPDSWVLGVEYTTESLSVTLSPFQVSRKGYGNMFRRYWQLGAGRASDTNATYWQQVSQAVKDQKPRDPWRITDIVLMGESAKHERFLRVLQDTLWEMLPRDRALFTISQLANSVVDPEYAASLGAAELAKRILEAPDGCVERSYCDWWRRHWMENQVSSQKPLTDQL